MLSCGGRSLRGCDECQGSAIAPATWLTADAVGSCGVDWWYAAARTSLVVRASEAERRAANLDTRKSKTQLKHASIRHKVHPGSWHLDPLWSERLSAPGASCLRVGWIQPSGWPHW